jgi:hypothetical protein
MSNPATQSITIQILSDPKALTTLIAAIITLLIATISFIANFVLYHKRRIEQRKYEAEYEFYKVTVLSSLKELSGFANVMKININLLKIDLKDKPDDRRIIVERYSNKIDTEYNDLLNNILPIVMGYSNELAKKIEKISEKLFDETTDIYSKYSTSDLNDDYRYRTKLNVEMTKYIKSLFGFIRDYRPGNKN